MIGAQRPDFSLEHQIGRVRGGDQGARIDYPSRSTTTTQPWSGFDNHYWAALYSVDAHGIIRDHVGERRYAQSELAAQRLLSVERDLVGVEGLGALIGVLGFSP